MIFDSRLELPPVPNSDVFNYVFHHGRREYPSDRVLYRVDGKEDTLTLGDLERKSKQFAHALRTEYDIRPGDVVSILAKDRIEYPIAYYGAIASGATIALIPIQKEMSETDVAARLEQARAKLLITDPEVLFRAEVASVLAGVVPLMTMDANKEGWTCMEDLIKVEIKMQLADEHEAFINRTSGSTRTMKSVITSDAHFIATMEATKRTIPDNTDPDNDVWLSPLSLGFFINAKLMMGLNIILGIPVVLADGTLDESNIGVIERHRITFLFITPPLAARLARCDVSGVGVSSVKWMLTAGAPIHENLRRTVSDNFGGVHLTLEWATSETMLLAIQLDESTKKPGSSGTLANGVQAKVINTETGAECGIREEGEILVCNKLARYKGYKDNEAANQDFDSEGWFHTKDYGYLDENCNVYIIDRTKELLKVSEGYGSHVSASELESVIFEYPAVASVVVVGTRNYDTQMDEPSAFIILKPEYANNSKVAKMRVERFAAEKLTGLRRLTGGIHWLSSYPTTGFKIDRKKLKAMVPEKQEPMATGLFLPPVLAN
ncbi:AMP-binding enzyme [Trichophyton tonsurans CBS 112818]|uniref:AMP-binding enzyme n=1 Tax=Trichophyton tonsurans (strain CBS 112818) TaxID=647933 RepID=F2S6S8_TRIT1|nr:AMP-binding enzyme [Trichophyton tonsurans CBS 112818]